MKKSAFLLFFVASAIAALSFFASCNEESSVAKSYRQSEELTRKPAAWSQTQPQLANMPDSASYLMGYIFGGNINRMIERKILPELENVNHAEFERGIAMALQADSSQLDLFYGIMLGLDLRNNLSKMGESQQFQWNSTLTYRGFYQGFNNTIPTSLALPMAEEELGRLLYSNTDAATEIDY